MNRRELFYSLLGVSALPAFVQAQSATQTPGDGIPNLTLLTPDAIASGVLHFFTPQEFASFRKLADMIVSASDGEPGALDARAPEFLDFLLSESPAEIQTLYRNGVRLLDQKGFAKLGQSETSKVLAPLSDAWTYSGPTDPFAQFLQASKIAFWQATVNSREWAQAKSGGRRSAAGLNTYWLPIE
jgi:hypothetical protein